VIDASLLSVMRRWYFRDGLSQREITKHIGLSRNTVRRYLKNDIADPVYTKRQTLGKVDEFEELLISWLKREARRHRKERIVNRRFLTMVSHYLFEADFCNPAAGWEKGQVEKNVRDARSVIW
jgi:transposase